MVTNLNSGHHLLRPLFLSQRISRRLPSPDGFNRRQWWHFASSRSFPARNEDAWFPYRHLQIPSLIGARATHSSDGKVPTVVVGMSGGVDSAVSAYLLKHRGFHVIGLHMINWDGNDELGRPSEGTSCSILEADFRDVCAVCDRIGIHVKQVNFVKEYWTDVFEPMIDGYSQGITPNPDVLCNRHIKFDVFLKYAREELGADFVATGHYAQTDNMGSLRAGIDSNKDQSYFLSGVSSAALSNVIFPIGSLRKEQVRRIAKVAGLEEVAEKKDSYGICFVGKRDFKSFIHEYLQPKPGKFIHVDSGQVVGRHSGAAGYTIGQGARIAGIREKLYVVSKNIEDGSVFVAPGSHPALFSTHAIVKQDVFRWVSGKSPEVLTRAGAKAPNEGNSNFDSMRCQFRVRYREILAWCTVQLHEDMLIVEFDEPQLAVAPGQVLALYQGDLCLGGGEIFK